MADFFSTRDAIKQRIEENIQAVRKVYFAEELENVTDKGQISPAVHVMYGGYQPAQSERIRQDITLDQIWVTVLAIKHATNKYQGGEILDDLVRYLHGWKPSDSLLALELATSPISPSYRPGVAYFPLAFSTRVVNRK